MRVPLSVARGQRDPGARWTRPDWLIAQAWHELDRMICPGCGQPLFEGMDADLENAWVAELPIRCHPCTAISRKQESMENVDRPEALRWPVHRRDRRKP